MVIGVILVYYGLNDELPFAKTTSSPAKRIPVLSGDVDYYWPGTMGAADNSSAIHFLVIRVQVGRAVVTYLSLVLQPRTTHSSFHLIDLLRLRSVSGGSVSLITAN